MDTIEKFVHNLRHGFASRHRATQQFFIPEINNGLLDALLWGLGFGAVATITTMLVWVVCTTKLDMAYDSQAIANLIQAFLLIGFSTDSPPLNLDEDVPLILGGLLLILVTERMRDLGRNY